jgi:hypothetical protein
MGETKQLSGHGNLALPELALPESRSFTAFDDQPPLERNAIYLFVCHWKRTVI